ncbi:transmembrane protein 238-like isoform X3 [Syngnathoides biaculeatus]|nr:transmembrane protein 238-like isoform X3 [Syngnathoides biaculeatus]
MEPAYRGLGRCVCCFWLAVAFDVLGLLVLLIGVFVNVFFYDLLIYAGAIVIFLSLIWWVFWYSGNIEVLSAELEDDVGLVKKDKGALGGISVVVRRLSTRVYSGIRNSLRRNGGAQRHVPLRWSGMMQRCHPQQQRLSRHNGREDQ